MSSFFATLSPLKGLLAVIYKFLLQFDLQCNLPNFRSASNPIGIAMRHQCDSVWVPMYYIMPVRQSKKPTQGDNHFVPSPKGAQRFTGQAICWAGSGEKCPIYASADSFSSGLKKSKQMFRSKAVPKHI